MCKFFSFVTNGRGKYMYFDWKNRKKIIKGKLDYQPDSHSSIADFFRYKGGKEDALNKYEYNPLTKEFKVDQINAKRDDRENAEKWANKLDFSKIVKPLIIKDMFHPFKDAKEYKVTKADIKNLKKWASVSYSVWDSVMDSVRASVMASVWDSVRDSVMDSVMASVRDSVYCYYSSFFDIKYKYDFSICVKLWDRGFVPSFDGTTWRLHQGKDAKVVYEWKPSK